ncbi:Formyltransferase [Sparassis latifolia]
MYHIGMRWGNWQLHRHLIFRGIRGLHRSSSPTGRPFKVLFFGRDEFSCLVLEQFHAAEDVWDEIQIVTQPDMKTGRHGSKISVSPLKILGQQLDLPVHSIPPDKPGFRSWKPPQPFGTGESSTQSLPSAAHLLITASFGRILPTSLLYQFLPSRRLNVHPSLLPAYRGAAPIQHALIEGRKETGVCVIQMTEFKKGIDSGDIWGSKRLPIPDNIAFPELRDRLALEGGKLLVSVLRDMMAGKANSIPQPFDPAAPRAPLIKAEDTVINFKTMPAEDIVRCYRGISHQKPIMAYLKTNRTLQLHSPTSLAEWPSRLRGYLPEPGTATFHPPSKNLLIRCASDTLLSVPQVKQQDRSLISAKEWWNGVRPVQVCLNPR